MIHNSICCDSNNPSAGLATDKVRPRRSLFGSKMTYLQRYLYCSYSPGPNEVNVQRQTGRFPDFMIGYYGDESFSDVVWGVTRFLMHGEYIANSIRRDIEIAPVGLPKDQAPVVRIANDIFTELSLR